MGEDSLCSFVRGVQDVLVLVAVVVEMASLR